MVDIKNVMYAVALDIPTTTPHLTAAYACPYCTHALELNSSVAVQCECGRQYGLRVYVDVVLLTDASMITGDTPHA